MKKVLFLFGALCLLFVLVPKVYAASLAAGDLIKASQPAVYYYGADGKRYVFPNEGTYKTWYSDFSTVKTITDAELAAVSIGGNVTYKAGVKMVKITTDPKVYAVAKKGVLRWVKTEAAAVALYGADWNKKIEDVPDAFFTNYTVGADIAGATDFDKAVETAADIIGPAPAVPCSGCGSQVPPAPAYSWNIKTINGDVYGHKNLAFGNFSNGFVASWGDDRNGQNEIYYGTTDLAAAGSGVASRVSNNITDSANAKNSFDGMNLYFLWEDSSPQKRAIYVQKHDSGGNKVKLSVFASTTYATSKYPDIAWNESLGKYGAVWWDTRKTMSGGSGDLYFSLMTKDGLKTGAELVLTTTASPEFKPCVVSANNKFSAIWQEGDMGVRVALVDSNSALVGSVKNIYIAGEAMEPRIAWSGSGFGTVWAENVGDAKDIYFMRLDSSGNKVGDKIALTSGAGDAAEPSILWSGDKFYIAYTNYKPNAVGAVSDVRLVKVNTDGTVAAAAAGVSSAGVNAYSPNLAKSGSTIGMAWLENGGATNKIMGAVETKN